jgi:RNA polymerase sigma-70 factor (ECF subfamily)
VNRFQTTRWSLVLAARSDSVESRLALDTLCRTYRSPVLAYVRGRGYSADEAEDLAQTFFTRFIERAFHAHADPARGRFRAFLLTALKHFLNDANDAARAAKRGGEVHVRSLSSLVGGDDSLTRIEDAETPERAFERAWAHSMLQTALNRLREEAREAGKSELFGHLREFLVERPDDVDYARVADDLNLRRNTVAVAVHRLRHRLRTLVCEELAHTAADDTDLEQELEELRHSLGAVIQ